MERPPLTRWEQIRRDIIVRSLPARKKAPPPSPATEASAESTPKAVEAVEAVEVPWAPGTPPIKLVCLSDTHSLEPPDVPDGDVLIHAGDLTGHGLFDEMQAQLRWINSLPHKYKIVVGGNHDLILDRTFALDRPERKPVGEPEDLEWGDIHYLENTSVRLDFGTRSINVYGSPYTPQIGTFAFQYPRIRDVWANTVPDDTDVLITHGPPRGYLDQAGFFKKHVGCDHLLREVYRVKPRVHVFGHIHECRGRTTLTYDRVNQAHDQLAMGDIPSLPSALATVASSWLGGGGGRRPSSKPPSLLINAAVMGDWRSRDDLSFDDVVVEL